jgi:sugar (pentulose or hexulose) kinase
MVVRQQEGILSKGGKPKDSVDSGKPRNDPNMTIFIGLDLGSTSIKGAVLDVERDVVDSVKSRPFPDALGGLPTSHFEVDPRAVVTETRAVLDELLACTTDVEGVVVCSQMGGVLVCDRRGSLLTNYLSWRDQRVLGQHPDDDGSYIEHLQRRTTPEDLARAGNELRPGSAASLLFWLQESGALAQKDVVAMNIGDYVVSQLCGSPPKTEPTLALGTLNLETGQPLEAWFDRLDLGHVRWPELTEVTQPAGLLSHDRLSHPIPVYPAVGDQQAALLGADLAAGELSLNISTGSQVSLLTESLQPGKYQTRPYFRGQFLNTITHLPAGRSLNALLALLGELAAAEGYALRDPWSTISNAVEQVTASDLDVNLAFFAGTMGTQGHIRNMRLENLTVGKLFHAAFRHMAENFLQCAEQLSPATEWQRVVLSGGLPQKLPSLRQMIEERFACPIRAVNIAEETFAGLLSLARMTRT